MSRPDLEASWPGRRLHAVDGLCPRAAPARVPARAATGRLTEVR
ncbi:MULTISPECIES: hypothetical protein [unclassified Blastococcus]